MDHAGWSFGLAAAALCALVLQYATTDEGAGEAQRIRALIGSTFDKPETKVETDLVVVVGDHGVAGWTQGDRGGRALLRRERGAWQIVLCAGEGLRHADMLEQSGVPKNTALTLSKKLAAAEAGVPPDRRRQFDLFGPATTPQAGHHGGHVDHPPAPHPGPGH